MRKRMDEKLAMEQVSETGRLLLGRGLVARTWGNFSARLDGDSFCITPSGLGYEHMTPEDTVRCRISDGTCEGTRRPSSEKGIHAAAYRIFPDTGFVIHTHQTYATALSLGGLGQIPITAEERERLGGIAVAGYGLPGTKKLRSAVSAALEQGAHTVLMAHHGALICGCDRADAMERAELLEEICRRGCLGQDPDPEAGRKAVTAEYFRRVYPTADIEASGPVLTWAALKLPLPAQLDDMVQMMGRSVPVAGNEKEALALLGKHSSVLLPGTGAIVRGDDLEDTQALLLLTRKAAVAALHCRALGRPCRLSLTDCLAMRAFYLLKYSKRKKEG